jgi:hypothetical protein
VHPAIGNYTISGWPVRFGDAPPAVGPAPLKMDYRHAARRQGHSR